MTPPIHVPLLDLKAQYDAIRHEVEPVLRDVVESQWFILGDKVQSFETAIASYCATRHAVGCASGTDAILLALMAVDVEPGDEVLCPSYTFFATAGSISRLGARPVFVDIDPTTFNMHVDSAREAARECTRLKAIMPVHLFGRAVDMDGFLKLGEAFGVPIIEDAAQAIGTRDATGAPAGSRGAVACFSFFPSKNLGAFGDGGMITTNDAQLAERITQLRVHGGRTKYHHDLVGMNSRLDALQAAVLEVKLRHLETWHARRQHNAAWYDEAFAEAGARDSRVPLTDGGLPLRTPAPVQPPARHIYNQYVIRVPATLRDGLREHLRKNNIGTEIYYPVPLHLQPCFADLGYSPGDLPETESAANETLALPVYPELTEAQRRHVVDMVLSYVTSDAHVPA